MTRYYTGVGHSAYNVDDEGKDFILWLSAEMFRRGFTLISGDTDGSDEYFEHNSGGNCLIYLPSLTLGCYLGLDKGKRYVLSADECEYAYNELYSKGILPEIKTMPDRDREYACRNFYQSFNKGDLPEVCFYYAQELNGVIYGGTRTAVYTARHYGTPCYNLFTKEDREIVRKLIKDGQLD